MKWFDLFYISILSNIPPDITPHDISLYKDEVMSSSFSENEGKFSITSTSKLLENHIFSKLSKNIRHISKEYLKEIGHIFEDIQITNSWALISSKDNEVDYHKHSNSYLSGVYYLTEGSPIVFENPLQKMYDFKPELSNEVSNPRNYRVFQITPIPNLLIIFPSYLFHMVLNSTQNIPRISIAFNIIPKGEFGPPTAKLYL